jgi:hypothetical protein
VNEHPLARRILVVDDHPARGAGRAHGRPAARRRQAPARRDAARRLDARPRACLAPPPAQRRPARFIGASFVVAANVLASVPRARATVSETEPLMSRLAQVLSPFGLTSRASSWLDWTMETVAA